MEILSMNERERSNNEQYMLWKVEKEGKDPFEYFEEKRGYPPTQVIIGRGTNVEVPEGVSILAGTAQTGHILIR